MMRALMQSLLELAPLAAFVVAYYAANLYTATAVLMASMALLLAVDYARLRRIPPMHGLSAVLVFIFGGTTLALHDQRFIQWKPTVFFWLAGVAFLASRWIGERPLVQRFFETALAAKADSVSREQWRRLNWIWVLFYGALGALNLFVAFSASERAWVNFKVFGLTGITFIFIAAQFSWLAKRVGVAQA